MLYSISRTAFVIILSFFLSCILSAQETAPYSRFGLGEIGSSNFTTSKGMGGIAAAYRSPLHINFTNPASYSALAFTTLETGVIFTRKSIIDKDRTYKTNDGFIDYISFGIPGKKAGGSFGMIPYSKMNYVFEETKNYPAVGDYNKRYEGNGRLYQLYGGAAFRYPGNDTANTFSIGANVSYIFGKLRESEYSIFADSVGLNIRKSSTAQVGNLGITAGLQYRKALPKKLSLIFGAHGFIPIDVNSNYEEVIATFYAGSSSSLDTVTEFPSLDKDVNLPVQIGFGITLDKIEKLTAGIDFSYSLWSKFEDLNDDVPLHDSWRISVGGEYRPDSKPQSSFIKRSFYRVGGYYDYGFIRVKDTNISEYGITFGLGIPVKSFFSKLNVSFEVGSRGTRTNDLIKENFFKAYIGFTLNDKWFIKRKYD